MDLKSLYGYRSDSPYRKSPFLDINTPEGLITMEDTDMNLLGVDNLGNVQMMEAGRKQPYKFPGSQVREIPMQMGGNPYQNGGVSSQQLFEYLFSEEEEDAMPVNEEQQEMEQDKEPALTRNERILQQRTADELAMGEAMTGFENPYRRSPAMEFGNDLLDFDEQEQPTYTGQLSSGKYGAQNIGQQGKRIIADVTNALGYTPTFNSIFRDQAQQQKLVQQGIGAKNSYHLTGDAVDMKPADWNNLPDDKKMYFRANYDVVYHNNHYHIEPK